MQAHRRRIGAPDGACAQILPRPSRIQCIVPPDAESRTRNRQSGLPFLRRTTSTKAVVRVSGRRIHHEGAKTRRVGVPLLRRRQSHNDAGGPSAAGDCLRRCSGIWASSCLRVFVVSLPFRLEGTKPFRLRSHSGLSGWRLRFRSGATRRSVRKFTYEADFTAQQHGKAAASG